MDEVKFKELEGKLFEAIKAGERDKALEILVEMDYGFTGLSDIEPGGLRRMFAEVDMDQFIERVKAKHENAYNAVQFGDRDRKLYIWCKGGELSTEWTSNTAQNKMWDDLSKL